jgi:microcin C transport system permease protein
MGASTWRIISVHILPNILVVVLTSLPFAVEGAISALTALDYLGFGLRPPTPSWGELISQGISAYQAAPWIIASVGGAMTFVLVLIAFVGEGLRDAFDPKKYTVYQ